MAKFEESTGITGTVQGILFYKRGNTYLARAASSLTRQRVLKDKAFGKTMQEAGYMAKASPIASALYQSLPKNKRNHALFHDLVSAAKKYIKAGLSAKQTARLLKKDFPVFTTLRKVRKANSKTKTTRTGIPADNLAVA